jgi:hypothetical protein
MINLSKREKIEELIFLSKGLITNGPLDIEQTDSDEYCRCLFEAIQYEENFRLKILSKLIKLH